jgi:hypothetical protein
MKDEAELRSLLRDIANEAVDKTEWLKRSEAKELVEKHSARQEYITIAEMLVYKGFIDARHKDYGFDYMELRRATYGALEAKTSSAMYKLGEANLKRNNACRVYEMVSKEIGRQAEHFIENGLNTRTDDSIRFEFVANVYRLAFETLEGAIDRTLKILSEEKEVAN